MGGPTAPPRPAEEGAEIPSKTGRATLLSGVAFAGIVALAVLAVYLVHPLINGHRLPIGPDGPVYAWWTRYVDVAGLGALGRPGIPGGALVLGTALGTNAIDTVTLFGPVLAVISGLAAAALVETALGPDRLRSAAVAVLTAGFAGHLAPGWLANLALAGLFLGTLAAFALAERSWRPVILGAALLAAAGVAHPPFLFISAAILAGVVIAFLVATRSGNPMEGTATARIAAGTAAGVAGAFAGLLVVPGGPSPTGDSSQDHLLRRAGLGGILRSRFVERFGEDSLRLIAPVGAGVALMVPDPLRRAWREHRYVAALVLSWAGITLLAIPVFLATGLAPASRMITFAFFLPLAAGLGLVAAIRRWGLRSVNGGIAVLAAAVLLGGSLVGWYRQRPFVNEGELVSMERANEVLRSLPDGTPLIFLVDTLEKAAGFHVTRFGNVIRTAMPADRIDDMHLALGRPDDFLRGEPTGQADEEYDRLSEFYLRQAVPIRRPAAALVLRTFNRHNYELARRLGTEVSLGVVALTGGTVGVGRELPPAARAVLEEPRRVPPRTGILPLLAAPGMGAVGLLLLSVAALVLLTALGWGWSRWGLPGVGARAAASLAPAAGLAVVIVGALLAELLRLGAGGPGGLAVVAVLGAAGYAGAVRAKNTVDG